MEGAGGGEGCSSSFLVGDSPLSGGQHIVEGVSANASPGEEAT